MRMINKDNKIWFVEMNSIWRNELYKQYDFVRTLNEYYMYMLCQWILYD